MTDREKLHKLAKAATDGPWEDVFQRHIGDVRMSFMVDKVLSVGSLNVHDAAYIAAANPKVMLELLDKLKAATELTKEWRKRNILSVWNECARQLDKVLNEEMK